MEFAKTESCSRKMMLLFYFLACTGLVGVRLAAGAACGYPAIFSFGDSLTDTGNAIRTSPVFFTTTQLPYGETYFERPALRFCDGRLVIDFLAQSLGLPFLNPYLAYKDLGTDFSNGVNYAVAGATVQGTGVLLLEGGVNILTVDNLNVQIGWHLNIKQMRVPDLLLPSPQSFSEGLYFFSIGGNDYGNVLLGQYLRLGQMMKPEISNAKTLKLVPTVVGKLIQGIETLYANEARNFFILNVGPEGCAPLYLKLLNGTKDAQGCLEDINALAQVHNQNLFNGLQGLREKYADIDIIYADFYSAYYQVVKNPTAYGFVEAINACCGAGPGVEDQFKISMICKKGRYVCPDPSIFVQWDGVHNTDAFNRYIINQFVSENHILPSNGLGCATQV